ncbi:testicular haploid expressed gene protein-like [Actinia tenebrosa]|uniref:Testicular haploid expressed gene protein-like n=1 Tax=Actinia tenebrosa TaxID=6105 RepID=A0A6P8IIY2_ACTTE|nr:testicular haploid expressed gene protein-like [Actinia tenebrosa]
MEKVMISSHPLYGYQFDIQQRAKLVPIIPELGAGRKSVFSEVRTPAYKKQHNVFKDFTIGRSSPIWGIKKGKMKPNNRLVQLSKPKQLHPDYQPCKNTETLVAPSAKTAACSSRLDTLSEPKKRTEPPPREWKIEKSSLTAQPSERIVRLSNPRGYAQGFLPDNFESWRVSKAAIEAKPSGRVEELSKPMVREIASNLPRADAFVVSMAAQKATCSERIAELSQPVKR